MKSKVSIIIYSITLLIASCSVHRAYSGGGAWYSPAEYYTFRVYDWSKLRDYDKYEKTPYTTDIARNCELWQQITSAEIPLKYIYQVVYRYSSENIQQVSRLIECPIQDTLKNNPFVKWIVLQKEKEIADYLHLMKVCEDTRDKLIDPWYYPTDNDHVSTTLSDVSRQAQAYNGNRLRDRYALLAIRSLFASSRYDTCINYWNEIEEFLPDGLIKQLIQPYIAGAYYRTGAIERAMHIYAECGDVSSLLFCAGKQGKEVNEIEQLELLYKYYPDSPRFVKFLQNRIKSVETDIYEYKRDQQKWNDLIRLRDFAWKVAREGKAKNRAMWYYTAAYLSDLNGEIQTALNLLAKAEKTQGDSYVKESIMVLRIYLDAKSCVYDAGYEQKLFEQLRWLDNKIKSNIDDHVRQVTMEGGFWANFSYYYWNDMMRKIILSVIAPRYIAHGNYVRAIQLTNMADNHLLNLVGKQKTYIDETIVSLAEYRKSKKWYNGIDYRNALFALSDTIGVDHVIAYTQRLKRPQTQFDRFINERSYTDLDFFNDLIGTQCLRDMRYADAVKYLGQVSSSFQYAMNTFKDGFMKRDPFSLRASSLLDNTSDYKYNFAREMHSLEQSIKQTTEPNRKAQLQIKYAMGLENSINRCWALTQYYKGEYLYGFSYDMDWTKREAWKRANTRCKRLLKEAFAMFTDKEAAANAHWLLGNNVTIMNNYPDTEIAAYVRQHCDCLKDYVGQ